MAALKKFGLGIIWALLFPFIVVGIAFVGLFGTVNFLIEFVIMVINFVTGKKLFPVYPEDKKAYDILQRAIAKRNGEATSPLPDQPPAQQVFVQQNFYGAVPPGALPPGYGQPQLPPGYGQPLPPGYTQQIPPGYQQQQLPPGYTSQQLPPQQPPVNENPQVQEAIPPRPQLAELPAFNPSEFGGDAPRQIEIDIDEGGGGND